MFATVATTNAAKKSWTFTHIYRQQWNYKVWNEDQIQDENTERAEERLKLDLCIPEHCHMTGKTNKRGQIRGHWHGPQEPLTPSTASVKWKTADWKQSASTLNLEGKPGLNLGHNLVRKCVGGYEWRQRIWSQSLGVNLEHLRRLPEPLQQNRNTNGARLVSLFQTTALTSHFVLYLYKWNGAL